MRNSRERVLRHVFGALRPSPPEEFFPSFKRALRRGTSFSYVTREGRKWAAFGIKNMREVIGDVRRVGQELLAKRGPRYQPHKAARRRSLHRRSYT